MVYIDYRNKEKNFQIDRVEFSGATAFQDAVKWGRENLSNFNLDMISYN